jgi:D-apiose dehydrogenase
LHKALVTQAPDAGVATIVQKPFGRGPDPRAARLKHAKSSGLILAVHENVRFQPPHRVIHDLIEAGRTGC